MIAAVTARDVATALAFARAHGLEIAVRGGGHNPAGHVCDDGIVIDLSELRRVRVDAQARIARAQGGATWGDFDAATQAAWVSSRPASVVVTTSVGGLTLGGGIRHLTAQHGLTCDSLVGAELVTPDGTVLEVDADENAELLWGLRGGGGNFGVATRLDFRLYPLDGLIGGILEYRGEAVPDALRRFRDVVAASPGTSAARPCSSWTTRRGRCSSSRRRTRAGR